MCGRVKEDGQPKRFARIDSTNIWVLFERLDVPSGEWFNFKLVIPRQRGEKRRRTRFWFGWHSGKQRPSRTTDTIALEVMFPEIHAQVMDSLEGYFGG